MKPSAALWMLPLLGGCLSVADERALRDLEIGSGANDLLTVTVADGLAAVRSLEGRTLHLWANAPAFTLTLEAASPGPVSVRIENLLADAALLGRGVGAKMPGPTVTEATWEVTADGDRHTLTLEPPDRLDHAPWRFAVFADVQSALDDVQDLYVILERQEARFALIAGDLTEQGSAVDLLRFQTEMKSLSIPAYATLGNHELGNRDDLFHDFFGRGTSSFVFRGVRFTFVDSASATLSPIAADMIEPWLARPEDRLHVVTMHIPPLDPVGVRNGSFASRAEAARLLSQLAVGGVDVTFYGHIHSYYAFDNAGIPAFITGGGGAIPERFDGIGRHFLTVDIDPQTESVRTGLVRVD